MGSPKCALGMLVAMLSCLAQPAAAQSETPPQLVVAISVDQFSADLFNEYRATFTGGLKRLSSGVVFPRAYQSHAGTETCPGHSTILTGARPSRTGIIANSWIDQSVSRPDKTIYCVEDEREPGSSSKTYVASLLHLRTPTLGDRMKQADPEMRVVSVAGKDRAALLLGGGSADQLWWIGPEGFATLAGRRAPARVDEANAAFAAALATPRAGVPLQAQCEARDLAVDIGDGKVLGRGRFAREAGDFLGLRATPEYDAMVLNLAGLLTEDLGLGRRGHTDLLALGLSATDYIGHTFGNGGAESCLQLAALDQALGAFFDRLDGLGVDYVVMLTADHGGHDLPERHRQNAMPHEARIAADLYPAALSAALTHETGLAGPLVLAPEPVGDLYIASALTGGDRARVEALLIERLSAHPQILRVFKRDEIAATPLATSAPDDWTLIERVRASFDPERSGDLFVVAQPWVTQESDAGKRYIAMHGRPFDNDRRVPLMFWRQGLRGFEQPLAVETVDIAPTLAALVGLVVEPDEMDGRCLDLLAGPANSCGAD